MCFKRSICVLVILLPIHAFSQITIPDEGFGAGWKVAGKMREFSGDNLYGYINGGAELFKEYGFSSLRVQMYARGDAEIGLEVYEMTSPESALGIYLSRHGNNQGHSDIDSRNTCDEYQLTVQKNRYYLILNNYTGDPEFVPDMLELAKLVLANVAESPIHLLERLPEKGRILGSEYIFRGPFALQPIYTFGEGDIFQLQGKIFGVLADYYLKADTTYTWMSIEYPDKAMSRSVFRNLIENLDPYNKLITANDSLLHFQDYQGLLSQVKLDDKRIECHIKLPELPFIESR